MSKINVYSSSASNAIKVFDANSTGLKPDNAILVTTGTEPSNAIQINVGEKKFSSIAVKFGGDSPVPPGPTPEPDYTLLQSDLRTLSLSNATQTLGSQIDLSNLTHRFLCVKFGATNNHKSYGAYRVELSPNMMSDLRWNSLSSSGTGKRAPLSYGLTSVSVNHNAYYKENNSDKYFATNSTEFNSGVWAEYKIIIDLDTGRVRTWVTNADSYIEYNISIPVTTFNGVSCLGGGSMAQSAIRNLYVYIAKSWDIATEL